MDYLSSKDRKSGNEILFYEQGMIIPKKMREHTVVARYRGNFTKLKFSSCEVFLFYFIIRQNMHLR